VEDNRYKLKLLNLYCKDNSGSERNKAVEISKQLFDSCREDNGFIKQLVELIEHIDGEEDFKISVYKEYISKNPGDVSVTAGYMGMLLKAERYNDLQIIYENELNLKPSSMKLIYELAGIYYLNKQYEDAGRKYEQILSSDNYYKFMDYDLIHARLAFSLMKGGSLDEAYTHYKKALPFNEALQGLYELAKAYENNNEINKAQHCYRIIYGHNPDYLDVFDKFISFS
jgi:tetratricopeptide (TPR) repeat protein